MTQQDLQGIADQVAPGSQVRDPNAFAQFLSDKANEYNSVRNFFDRTIGRVAGAAGRGALGVGRFAEQGFAPTLRSFAPIANDPNIVQPTLNAAQQYSNTTGGVAAENLSSLLSGTSYGLGPNSFDSFMAQLEQKRQEQGIIDALTLGANRQAFQNTQFPPGVSLALQTVGDPLTYIAPERLLASGALRSAGERAAGEGLASVARTGAREIAPAVTGRAAQENALRGVAEQAQQGVREAAQRSGELAQIRQQAVNEAFNVPEKQVSARTAFKNIELPKAAPSGGAPDITPDDLRSVQQSIGRDLTVGEIGSISPDAAKQYAQQRAQQLAQQRIETELVVDKLSAQLEKAQPLRPDQIEALRHTERQARVKAGASALEGNQGQEAFAKAASQLRGELPNPSFQAPTMTGEDVFLMNEHIRNLPDTRFFTKLNTQNALNKLLLGESPTVSELRLLEKAFGRNLVESFLRRPRGARQAATFITDLLGVPKTIRSAFDLSAPLRQGLLLGPANPREFGGALKAMFQSFSSEKAYQINREIFGDPDIQRLLDDGLFLHNVEGAGPAALQAREEAYISKLATKIPGINLSERTYGTFLNKLRADVAKKAINEWRAEGVLPAKALTQADLTVEQVARLQSLSRFINVFTGRGTVPQRFQGVADALNIAFWSPRLTISRFEAPTLLADPFVRKQTAQNLAATFATGMTVLAMVESALPGKQVEVDPRSTDFGKIRLGNTRLDFWGGFQQIARYMAQIATNQTKNPDTGAVYAPNDENRIDRGVAFLRSKVSPGLATLIANELFGKTYAGDVLNKPPVRGALPSQPVPLRQGAEAIGLKNAREQEAIQQLTPLFGLDLVNAMEQNGLFGGTILSIPGLFGVGVQAYNEQPQTAQTQTPRGRISSGLQFK